MNKQDILKEFNERIQRTNKLTFLNLDGLVDSPNDVDDYIENYINTLFDNTSKELGWTFQELENWYEKNWI